MPSPFPGMDPYLESPDWFPDLHDGLIFTIKAALQTSLPRAYYARTRQHVWLDLGHRPPVEPDVDILRSGGPEVRPTTARRPTMAALPWPKPVTSDPVVVSVELDLRRPVARALPRDPSPPGNRRRGRRRLRDPQSVEQDARGPWPQPLRGQAARDLAVAGSPDRDRLAPSRHARDGRAAGVGSRQGRLV